MDQSWEPISGPKLAGFLAGALVLVLALFWAEPGFVPVLDHANLLFHEAGHPIVGLFSSRLEPYGGTIGQLVFPVVLAVTFWRKRQAVAVAFSTLWFLENWFNIARYMADARRLQLPLVGGGDHDWNTILNRWDILQFDARIAAALGVIAWCGILAVTLAVLGAFWVQRCRPAVEAESPLFAETE